MAGGRSRLRGFALQAIGIIVQLVCVGVDAVAVPAVAWFSYHKVYFWIFPILILAGIAFRVFPGGRRLVVLGRRYRTSSIVAVEQVARSPFVLYLRSFDDDLARQETESLGHEQGELLGTLFFSTRTQEERIAAVFKPVGRVVAVGRPGESLPPVGAHRVYLPHDAWQDAVADLMSRAEFVVIAVGSGRGLVWELVHAVRNVSPDRLILLAFMEHGSYGRFHRAITEEFSAVAEALRRDSARAWTAPTLPARLPEHESSFTTGWVIWFTNEWVAKPVAVDLARRQMAQRWLRTEDSIRNALWPVLRKVEPFASGELGNSLDDMVRAKERALLITSIAAGVTVLGGAGLVVGAAIIIAMKSSDVLFMAFPVLGAIVGAIFHRSVARMVFGPMKAGADDQPDRAGESDNEA